VVAEGRSRSSAASVRVTPEVRMSWTSEFMVKVILRESCVEGGEGLWTEMMGVGGGDERSPFAREAGSSSCSE